MNPMIEAEYRAGLRRLLATEGKVVEISERERKANPDSPQFWVSTYGWEDYTATRHFAASASQGGAPGLDYEKCELILPGGVEITEVSYSEFQDTFSDNSETVGINAYGGPEGADSEIRCRCGKYRGLTIRYESSLHEVLQSILGLNAVSFTL